MKKNLKSVGGFQFLITKFFKFIRDLIDTETTKDIILIMMGFTLCYNTLKNPASWQSVFEKALFLVLGFYFAKIKIKK